MNNFKKVKPAFDKCKNCLILCSDDGFMPATSVLMQSIYENSDQGLFYDIVILHSNIQPTTEEIIFGMFENAANFSVRFINIAEMVTNVDFYTANRNNFTSEAYYRLFVPWILDEEYEKALYIDGDMIAVKDISPVFDIDIGDNLIGAIRDYWGICNCYIPGDPRREYREGIGLTNIDSYVISCTILFNLKRFRNEFCLNDIIYMCASKNWLQHDQDVINILCKDSIHYITADWGMMCDYGNNHYLPQYLLDELNTVTDPALIHFGGGRKPWSYNYSLHDLDFWKYADHTPFLPTLLNKVNYLEYRGYVAGYISKGELFRYFDGTDNNRLYKGVSIGSLENCHTRYRVIRVNGNVLHLEGMIGFWGETLDSIVSVSFEINGEVVPATTHYCENGYNYEKKITKYRGEFFELDFLLAPAIKSYKIKLICEINGTNVYKTNLGFEQFSPLNRTFSNCYYHNDNWVVSTDKKILIVEYAKKSLVKKHERKFCYELYKTHKKSNYKAVCVRLAARFIKAFMRKPIWLVSDRLSKADENGEVFFRYLNSEKKKEVNSYFILDEKSTDYKRICKIGKVIKPYSYKHKILHLMAEYSISSQTDDIYRNPFKRFKTPYDDLLSKVKFVLLQHGIISNDLSDWLGRRTQNLTGFVCTTQREFNSIINGNYNYDDNVVWLTGLPRFDMLEDKREKYITVMPTWRMYLTKGQDKKTGIWNLVNNFRETSYVVFYRNLLSNPRLKEALTNMGYKIQFKAHPCFAAHAEMFGFDDSVNILGDDTSYREIYSKSSLIVTDYSSSIYDFLYLHKPVIYAQFDSEEFFGGKHIYEKGNFDYERDGFGEVTYDLESTVDIIIEYMKNDCQLKDKYRDRIENTFVFNDKNNCQRVYEKIRELDAKK